jgi:hypothetical protein
MKISLVKLERGWLSCFMYEVMGKVAANANDWKKIFGMNAEDPTEVDVCVTVNGVQVPFESFIDLLEKSHDTMLENKAKDLIEKSFGNVIDTLTEMQEHAKNKLESDVLPSWEKARRK